MRKQLALICHNCNEIVQKGKCYCENCGIISSGKYGIVYIKDFQFVELVNIYLDKNGKVVSYITTVQLKSGEISITENLKEVTNQIMEEIEGGY